MVPEAYGSLRNLIRASGLPPKKVSTFLHSRAAYTKFKPSTKTSPRLHAHATKIDDIWCIDLAQMDKLAQWNDNVYYLFVAIDIFSRFVRVSVLRNKTSKSPKTTFLKIMQSTRSQPRKIWSDRGKDFEGDFKSFCTSIGVHVYHTNSETKASYAERAIRSLKNIIYTDLENRKTDRYIDNLHHFVDTMNNRKNRSIGMVPANVTNKDFLKVMYTGRNCGTKKMMKPKLRVRDVIRIKRVEKTFAKDTSLNSQRNYSRLQKLPPQNLL